MIIFRLISQSNDVQITPNQMHFVQNFMRNPNNLTKLPFIPPIESNFEKKKLSYLNLQFSSHCESLGVGALPRFWNMRNLNPILFFQEND